MSCRTDSKGAAVMELYIHQKVFSIGQSFSVTDAQERLLYTVRGKVLS